MKHFPWKHSHVSLYPATPGEDLATVLTYEGAALKLLHNCKFCGELLDTKVFGTFYGDQARDVYKFALCILLR